MTVRFESARAKIARAQQHFGDFNTELDAYTSRSPFNLMGHQSPGVWEARVEVRESIPPILPIIFGDCVHNLRAALDHVVFETVARQSTRCEFPFLTAFNEAEWRQQVKKSVPGSASSPALALRSHMQSMQPHPGGANEMLWTLHRLDIIDKHRLLIAVCAATESVQAVTSVDGVEIGADGSSRAVSAFGELDVTWVPETRFPLEDGAVLVSIPGDGASQVKSVKCTLSVALAEPETIAGRDVRMVFHDLSREVESFVSAVEALLSAQDG